MHQPELDSTPVQLSVTVGDASDLPMYHVNAMNLRASSDEFFFTFAFAELPDRSEITELPVDGQVKVVAQPIFRFAVARDTMENFLTLMADTFERQTALREQMGKPGKEAKQRGVSKNE
jgi:hypothetical protein